MGRTALLVIDIQRGAFDGERCSPIDRARDLIDHALDLVNAARDGGAPVVYVQHCDGRGEVFEEGSPHWELHEALVPQPNDTLLRKHASSAFEDTDLAAMLQELEANELVLCGLQSEFCVYNTAKSALARGFAVVIARDAHSTWPSPNESARAIAEGINRDLELGGARLRSTADLARALRGAST